MLDHIAFIVASEQPDAHIAPTVEYAGLDIPQHLQSLYQVHPLQPFDLQGFTPEHLRYRDQWFTVAQQIQHATGQRQPWSNQTFEISDSDVIMLNQDGKISAHYVDSIGFKELPGFLDKKPERTSVLQTLKEKCDAPECNPTVCRKVRDAHEL